MQADRRVRVRELLLATAVVLSMSAVLAPGTARVTANSPALPSSGIVLNASTTLSANLVASSVTIEPGVTLTTNGHSILVAGTFDNLGTVVAGAAPWGAYPHSYGGSGGGAASSAYRSYIQAGASTRAAGGAAVTVGFNDSGSTPMPPAVLNGSVINGWRISGIQKYIAGASGGNVTGYITAGTGSFGVYIRAHKLIAGTIDTQGGAGSGHCSGIGLAGGGGGGTILLQYGGGGLTPGAYRFAGGARAYDCGYGTTASGAGGDGQVLTFPPVVSGSGTVISASTTLTGDLRAANLTILTGVTVTTNGFSILVNGTFANHGTVVGGTAPWGAFPNSYGGSGGGAASYNYRSYIQNGSATRAAGGTAITVGFNDSGSTPSAPSALNASVVAGWYTGGIQGYLAGASGGNVSGYITAGQGSFGVYIRATTLDPGTIDTAGGAGGGHCSGIGLSGAGGGGSILLEYGAGGLGGGVFSDTGGARAYDCGYGTTAGGTGGDGQLLTVATANVSTNGTGAPDWHQLAPTHGPPAIDWGAMAYIADQGTVLLFGGDNATSSTNASYLFAHSNWTKLNLTVAPAPRRGTAMAWDPIDHYVLLFGGATSNAGLGDTWKFVKGHWTQLHPSVAPSARTGAELVYDPAIPAMLLFGGTSNYCCSNAGLGDYWAFAHGNWTKLNVSPLPPQRNAYGFTYDARQGEALLFGGWQPSGGCGGPLNDTWVFVRGNWSQLPTPAGLGVRQGLALRYDPRLHQDILFGGLAGSCGTAQVYYGDTWAFDRSGWTQLYPLVSPPARDFAQMVYDPALGRILMVGGTSASGTNLSDSWTFG